MTLNEVLQWKPGTHVVLNTRMAFCDIKDERLVIRAIDRSAMNIMFKDNARSITNMRIPVTGNIENMPRGIKIIGINGWATVQLLEGRNRM